jgi:hypothetical protein
MTEPAPEVGIPGAQPTAAPPDPEDSRITILLIGQTSMPKAIDFYKVNPFQLLAIGEWLALKGKQMIAASENMEVEQQIQKGKIEVPTPQQILRAPK